MLDYNNIRFQRFGKQVCKQCDTLQKIGWLVQIANIGYFVSPIAQSGEFRVQAVSQLLNLQSCTLIYTFDSVKEGGGYKKSAIWGLILGGFEGLNLQ